ncbi:MAG: hypothetical protein K8F60_13950 [Melioribacteraceae bacterium]|nr:hypothetical protein [Melioribacteraceae bacterium]
MENELIIPLILFNIESGIIQTAFSKRTTYIDKFFNGIYLRSGKIIK